jgi:hypothetical protein
MQWGHAETPPRTWEYRQKNIGICLSVLEHTPRTWGILTLFRRTSVAIAKKHPHAHVGNILSESPQGPWPEKHPHARGEYGSLHHGNTESRKNTPPRTRGNSSVNKDLFISIVLKNNPHARGEYLHGCGSYTCPVETHPRHVGKFEDAQYRWKIFYGNTPTHVGNIFTPALSRMLRVETPPPRGEYARK